MLKRLRDMSKEERIEDANRRERDAMEQLLEQTSNLRRAGYEARIGWRESDGYTGLIVEVGCSGECGRWTQPLFGLPGATTCQQCWAENYPD